MDPSKPPAPRGRARGRSRGPVQAPDAPQPQAPATTLQERGGSESPPAEPMPETYKDMFVEDPHGNGGNGSNGNGNGSNGNGNGSNGNGSGSNGNGSNGNGNGNGENGHPRGRGSPSERGIPRGGAHGAETAVVQEEEAEIVTGHDYVLSKPAGSDFCKQGGGPNDKRVVVVSNYYSFRQKPDFQFCIYNVKVNPNVDEESKVRGLVSKTREEIGPYLLTGRQMFRTGPMPGENDRVKEFQNIQLRDSDVNYTVRYEFVRNVDSSEALVFQFYNVIARRMQSMLNLKLLGRYFYNPEQRREFGSWKLELWPGFQNSIRQQERKMLLNVENVWKVLQTESVFEKMKAIRTQNPDRFQEVCRSEFEGCQVVTNYNKCAYKIDSIEFNKHPSDTFPKFDKETGQTRQISYIDYYRQRYNIEIRIPKQPLLKTKPSKRDIRRGQVDDIYLIPELCWLSGLNESMRANFRLMKDLACCLHMQPTDRVMTMQKFVDRVTSQAEIKEEMKKWGCLVNRDPVEFEARSYPPEELIFGQSRKVKADDKADWTFAMRSEKMMTTVNCERWVIVVTARDSQNVNTLVQTMQRVATPLGYNIAKPLQVIQVPSPGANAFTKGVDEAINKFQGRLDMVLIVLPNPNADTYAAVKKRCSIQFGIPSQCFLAKHLNNPKSLMSICTKLVIQMNAKQGGEPWGAVVPLKDMMVLGYDVHHAGPGGGASFGAMTATMNASYGSYYSCVEQQTERSEIYTHVANMFNKCLLAYQKKNKMLPKRIIMYRDGVGEGQLHDVYTQELKGFEEQIQLLYKDGEKPKLTYIVVNKRINTRFFLKLQNNKYDNPKPGLVVDDHVTRPERYDFFLISQIARQGCVSPTYYNVLRDESGLAPDKIQRLTFKFCHLYYNWTGTVAVPAPCQNAHKLALQTGTALKGGAHRNLDYLLHFL